MKYKRIFLLILDSLGVGATNDSDRYGDGLANTLKNALNKNNVELPNFKTLGLLQLIEDSEDKISGYYTKATPASSSKNSVISHYEMMDVVLKNEYKKFSLDVIQKELFSLIYTEIDRKFIIVNKDSDENIINNYGSEQLKTGDIIVHYDYYTLKFFCHEASVPMKELVKISNFIMQKVEESGYFLNKIVAINFSGKPGNFNITKNKSFIGFTRPNESVLEKIKKKGYKIITIGKCTKIFNNCDITNICETSNDFDTIKKMIKSTTLNFEGVCISNFSSLNYWGHERNKESYSKILKTFDNSLPLLIGNLRKDDLLIISSDQGNDPTYDGNDHTREKVPVLVFNTEIQESGELPYLHTLADIGATIGDNFGIKKSKNGKSFLERIK